MESDVLDKGDIQKVLGRAGLGSTDISKILYCIKMYNTIIYIYIYICFDTYTNFDLFGLTLIYK